MCASKWSILNRINNIRYLKPEWCTNKWSLTCLKIKLPSAYKSHTHTHTHTHTHIYIYRERDRER